jgi:hypothetical protein
MKLQFKHYGIILFTLATAILHLAVYPDIPASDPIFLNGFGYLLLLAIYFLPGFQQSHKRDWWALVGYTALTFFLWILLGDMDFDHTRTSRIGYYAKTAEILLLIFLWADRPKGWNVRSPKTVKQM